MEALKNVKPTIDELRLLIGAVDGTFSREVLAFSLLAHGFTKGSVIEIVGSGKTEFLTQFLAENKNLRVAWIEPEITIYPFAFLQRDVDLSRILFVEAENDNTWVTLQILQAQIFQVVALSYLSFDERALRKIQLAAEKSQAIVVLLNKEKMKSWVPSLQVRVERPTKNDLRIETLRKRG